MFNKMIEEGYLNLHKLLLKEYVRLGINEKEVIVLSQLATMLEKKKHTLSLKSIARMTHLSSNEVGELLEQLIVNQFVSTELELKNDGKEREIFSLNPLFDKIIQLFKEDLKVENEKQSDNEIKAVITNLEDVFRKSLKPYDLQMIQQWFIDGYNKKEIDQALEVAINHNKLNLNYLDRILRTTDEMNDDDLDDEKRDLINKLIRGVK
ncbi:DNA replication protein DnaD [Paracholeplasma brassicae]|uniref:DNA replication protein DnaD n=1 Tax=Acholeplasma brassicae TaxID=61635 RepID=U4KMJ0_9MOLU|nr:DnaD domain protein [Paracholeplasma brassicae]CCV65377.1 DNA replication protein DnaD [Paracholeplasma brassicae]